jgi:hypothetical protein
VESTTELFSYLKQPFLPRYSPLSSFQALKPPKELSLRPPSTMCTSTATLLDGLWVTTASLAFAATAHHRTRSPFFAIDLILLRRRSGSLKVGSEGAKALVMIPPEVWEQDKHSMILIEARDAELAEIAQLRCEGCLQEDVMASLLAQALSGLRTAQEGVLKVRV